MKFRAICLLATLAIALNLFGATISDQPKASGHNPKDLILIDRYIAGTNYTTATIEDGVLFTRYGNRNLQQLSQVWSKMQAGQRVVWVVFGDSTAVDVPMGVAPYFRGVTGINGNGINGIFPYTWLTVSTGVSNYNAGLGVPFTNYWGGFWGISNGQSIVTSRYQSYDLTSTAEALEQVNTNVWGNQATVFGILRPNGAQATLMLSSNGSAYQAFTTINSSASTPSFLWANYPIRATNWCMKIVGTGGGDGSFQYIGGGISDTNAGGITFVQLNGSGKFYSDWLSCGTNMWPDLLRAINPDIVTIEGTHDMLPQSILSLFVDTCTNAPIVIVAAHALNGAAIEPEHSYGLATNLFTLSVSNNVAFYDGLSPLSNVVQNIKNNWYADATHLNTDGKLYQGSKFLQAAGLGDGQFGIGKVSANAQGNQVNLFNQPFRATRPVGLGTTDPRGTFNMRYTSSGFIFDNVFGPLNDDGRSYLFMTRNLPVGKSLDRTNAVLAFDGGGTEIGVQPGFPLSFGVNSSVNGDVMQRGTFDGNGGLNIGEFFYNGSYHPASGVANFQTSIAVGNPPQTIADASYYLYGNRLVLSSNALLQWAGNGASLQVTPREDYSGFVFRDNAQVADYLTFGLKTGFAESTMSLQAGTTWQGHTEIGAQTNAFGAIWANGYGVSSNGWTSSIPTLAEGQTIIRSSNGVLHTITQLGGVTTIDILGSGATATNSGGFASNVISIAQGTGTRTVTNALEVKIFIDTNVVKAIKVAASTNADNLVGTGGPSLIVGVDGAGRTNLLYRGTNLIASISTTNLTTNDITAPAVGKMLVIQPTGRWSGTNGIGGVTIQDSALTGTNAIGTAQPFTFYQEVDGTLNIVGEDYPAYKFGWGSGALGITAQHFFGDLNGNGSGITNALPSSLNATNTPTAGQVYTALNAGTGYWANVTGTNGGGSGASNFVQVIDVTQPPYNADNTGVANAGNAISNAILYANFTNGSPKTIYIPPGTYKLDKPGVTLFGTAPNSPYGTPQTNGYTIIGSPNQQSVIVYTNFNGAPFHYDTNAVFPYYIVLKDLFIKGPGGAANLNTNVVSQGITFGASVGGFGNKIEGCFITGFKNGITITGQVDTVIAHNVLVSNWLTGITLSHADTTLLLNNNILLGNSTGDKNSWSNSLAAMAFYPDDGTALGGSYGAGVVVIGGEVGDYPWATYNFGGERTVVIEGGNYERLNVGCHYIYSAMQTTITTPENVIVGTNFSAFVYGTNQGAKFATLINCNPNISSNRLVVIHDATGIYSPPTIVAPSDATPSWAVTWISGGNTNFYPAPVVANVGIMNTFYAAQQLRNSGQVGLGVGADNPSATAAGLLTLSANTAKYASIVGPSYSGSTYDMAIANLYSYDNSTHILAIGGDANGIGGTSLRGVDYLRFYSDNDILQLQCHGSVFAIQNAATVGTSLGVGGIISGNGAGVTNLNIASIIALTNKYGGLNFTNGIYSINMYVGSDSYFHLDGVDVKAADYVATGTTGFLGNGNSLTNLNATELRTGTVADARLSTNVLTYSLVGAGVNVTLTTNAGVLTIAAAGGGSGAQLAGTNVFTGTNTFNTNFNTLGPVVMNGATNYIRSLTSTNLQIVGVTGPTIDYNNNASFSTVQTVNGGFKAYPIGDISVQSITNAGPYIGSIAATSITGVITNSINAATGLVAQLTITLPLTNNFSVSNYNYAAGLMLKTNGDVNTTGTLTALGFESPTNSWTINAAFPVGQSNQVYASSSTVTVGVTGIANGPTTTERFGQLTIISTGTVTFTNPASFHTSDHVNSRVAGSGTNLVIAIDVIPGQSTNMAVVPF